MYSDQIKSASVVDKYRRRTNLDSLDQSKSEEQDPLKLDNKLDKEEQIDDFEIKVQFMALAEDENQPQMQEMNIENDIARLCQMYLNNVNKLKISLPSRHVENRMYEKLV